MGKLFLASRSPLSTVVLVLTDDGPAFPLPHAWIDEQSNPCPFGWGKDSEYAAHLAESLVVACRQRTGDLPLAHLMPLVNRLTACTSDVWVLTEADVLVGLPPVAYTESGQGPGTKDAGFVPSSKHL